MIDCHAYASQQTKESRSAARTEYQRGKFTQQPGAATVAASVPSSSSSSSSSSAAAAADEKHRDEDAEREDAAAAAAASEGAVAAADALRGGRFMAVARIFAGTLRSAAGPVAGDGADIGSASVDAGHLTVFGPKYNPSSSAVQPAHVATLSLASLRAHVLIGNDHDDLAEVSARE